MKICVLSDSPFLTTGYSNQIKLLCKYLREKNHEIHFFANAYQGQTIKKAILEDETTFDYKIYGQKSQYFQAEMESMLKEIKPDIFFILLDTFMLYPWLLEKDLSPAKTIFWFPSDGGSMPIGCENILKKVDVPVAMAKFGQKQVKDLNGINALHIPHGTEPKRFYKISDTDRQILRNKWGLNDKFVVGCVARNQPRKMLDRMIKSFAIACKEMPNAVLLCHLDPNDPASHFSMIEMVKRYNIENRVRYTGTTAFKGFDWEKMNEVYNLMDVFFLSTSGEGFGIPTIEAMSCEIPVIVTDYTTTEELVRENNSGECVKLVGTDKTTFFDKDTQDYDFSVSNGTLTGSWMVERGLIDIKDGAKKLIKLYNNPELCKEYGKNGRLAVLNKYDFNKCVGPAFEKLMESL